MYTFRWEDPDPDDRENLVVVSLGDRGDATEVVVEHGPFATEARRALHDEGWTDCLDRLEEVVAGRSRDAWSIVMLRCGMRTTVTLDPDVAAAVSHLRTERGIGVSAAINDLVRRGLATEATASLRAADVVDGSRRRSRSTTSPECSTCSRATR